MGRRKTLATQLDAKLQKETEMTSTDAVPDTATITGNSNDELHKIISAEINNALNLLNQSMNKTIAELRAESCKYHTIIIQLTDRLVNAEKCITDLNLEVAYLKESSTPTADINPTAWNLVVSKGSTPTPKNQDQINIINTVAHETRQREIRAKNIIIRGISAAPSSNSATVINHDQNEIVKIFDLLGVDKNIIVNHFRTKPSVKTPSSHGPIIVVLTDEKARTNVLKQVSTFFRNSNNRKNHTTFSINPDMTLNEQNHAYLLRTECRKRNAALSTSATTINVIRGNSIKEIHKDF